MNFIQFFQKYLLTEEDDWDEDSPEYQKAMMWFNYGHHGDHGDDPDANDGELDYCWIWRDNKLRVGQEPTHNMNFGYDTVESSRFKGWYDVGKNVITFYDLKGRVKEVDQIPSRVYNHLAKRFNCTNFIVF